MTWRAEQSVTDVTLRLADGTSHTTILVEPRPYGGRPSSVNAHTLAHLLDQLDEHARIHTIDIHRHRKDNT